MWGDSDPQRAGGTGAQLQGGGGPALGKSGPGQEHRAKGAKARDGGSRQGPPGPLGAPHGPRTPQETAMAGAGGPGASQAAAGQEGARMSHVLTKPLPPPSCREETLFPTVTKDPLCLKEDGEPRITPRLGSERLLGLGGGVCGLGVHNRARPPQSPYRRHEDFSPGPRHGCTWWQTVWLPGPGNPSAPGWFWKQLP